MKRLASLLLLPLAACAQGPNPDFPGISNPWSEQALHAPGSLKDATEPKQETASLPPAKPEPKKPVPITKPPKAASLQITPAAPAPAANEEQVYLGFPRVEVLSEYVGLRRKLELAMFNELNLKGHITKYGNWRIVGTVEEHTVRWRIYNAENKIVGDVDQQGLSDSAVRAVLPGILSYLPILL